MWYKNFRHKKMQSLMVFLIILLCSLLLTASVNILISLDKPFREFAKECDSPAAVIYPYTADDDEITALGEEFAKLDKVRKVELTRCHYLDETVLYNGSRIEGFLDLMEYKEGAYGKVRFLKGDKSILSSLKEKECILPACISNKYGIKTGDKLTLQLTGEEITYTVKGIYSDPFDASIAFNSAVLVKKLPEGISSVLRIRVYGEEGIKGSEIEEAFRLEHDGQLGGDIQTLEERVTNSLLASNMVGALLLAIGIIMLLVSGLIIHYMIRNAMITEAKTIAIYKTIGYTSKDILWMYLKFYFLLVSASCITGILFSGILSNRILSAVFRNMGQAVTYNVLLPGFICYLLTVFFVLLIVLLIIRKTKKVKPVSALSGMTQLGIHKSKSYKGNYGSSFSAFGIAFRMLARNKKGAVSILLTSVVTVFAINFAIISLDVAYSLKDNNDYWLGVDKCDVMIGVKNREAYEKMRKLAEKESQIDHYAASYISAAVMLPWKQGSSITSMEAFIYEDYTNVSLPLAEGRNPESAGEIAISGKISNALKKEIGDYMEIYLNGDRKVSLLITGIFQTYYSLGDCCRILSDVYRENNSPVQYNYLSIYLKDGVNVSDFMEDMKAKAGSSGNVIERKEAFGSIMEMISEPQMSAIPPVCLVVLLVSGISIFCIVMLKNAGNEKINGIYKSIGYSTGHLILSNLYYVGIIALISIGAALPLTLFAYPHIMKVCLSMFGFLKYPVNYNVMHLVLTNLAVLSLFLASTFLSSRSLKKIDVRSLVQE